MVMTILEARVSTDHWTALKEAFNRGAQMRDPGLAQSFLTQSKNDPEFWRIITVWSSQEALDTMRSSGETPRGVVMFRNAQAEPILSVFNVAQHIAPES
jgi:quinol monooxygenase YgiN